MGEAKIKYAGHRAIELDKETAGCDLALPVEETDIRSIKLRLNHDFNYMSRQSTEKGSSIVLWSGGIDSTAIIYNRLLAGYAVEAYYVELENNERKTETELVAIEKMRDIFVKEFGAIFSVRVIGSSWLTIDSRNCSGFSVPQLPIFMMHTAFAASGSMANEVAVGVISGDCACSWVEELKSLWSSFSSLTIKPLPELTFPMLKQSKEDVKRVVPTRYSDLCVWCEIPHNGKPCGDCNKCKAEIARQLYLI